MHFYPHNISDFNNSTWHLTRVERSVYRDAIERYYDTEKPLTRDFDRLAKRLSCFTDEEKTALEYILAEFFTVTDDGYSHERCDHEIEKYQAISTAKAKAGKASAAARKQKATERQQKRTRVEFRSTKQELRTKKQELYKNIAKKLEVPEKLIERIVKHRRDIKHPANTDKKITLVVNDLKKCVAQGIFPDLNEAMDKLDGTEWRTLKPDYCENQSNGKNPPAQPSQPTEQQQENNLRQQLETQIGSLSAAGYEYELTDDVSLAEHKKQIDELAFHAHMKKLNGGG